MGDISSIALETVVRGFDRVIALAGPSGAGKSRAADKTGLPCLPTDAFFLDATDSRVPLRQKVPDWEDVLSCDLDLAQQTLRRTLAGEAPPIPDYSYSLDARVGWLPGIEVSTSILLLEGTFAFEVSRAAEQCADVVRVGLVASKLMCAWSRIVRDLHNNRQGAVASALDSWRHARCHRERVARVLAQAHVVATRRDVDRILANLRTVWPDYQWFEGKG